MSDAHREVVRDFEGSVVLGDDSVILSDYSFADDTVFTRTNVCDQSHITISSTEDTTSSAFISSQDSPGAFDLTDSITNDDATKFSFGNAESDTKWSDARARCGKRFEKILGENFFRSGRFEMKPLSNSELEAAMVNESVFSYKKVEKFSDNATEIHADEIVRIENEEVVYVDYLVQAFFVMDDTLGDPRIFNESELETFPLGTMASYRLRIQEAALHFFGTKHKWECLIDGPIAQRLPQFVPGRELISNARANVLKIPYNEKAALERLDQLELLLDDKWIEDQSKLEVQMNTVLKILNLGAYSIPAKVLESKKLKIHMIDVMQKDLIRCLREIRQGLTFDPPTRLISIILGDYVRCSMDFLPYSFFCLHKSTGMVSINASEVPVCKVNVQAYDGNKSMLKFIFHVQVMESQYQNLYSHLFLFNHGANFDAAILMKKDDTMPNFTMTQALSLQNGNVALVSPPPHLGYKPNYSKVTPKGKYICCITDLKNLARKELIMEGEMEIDHELGVQVKQEGDEMEQ